MFDCLAGTVVQLLPSSWASVFRFGHSLCVTWYSVRLGTSIDREGLGESRTGTRQIQLALKHLVHA